MILFHHMNSQDQTQAVRVGEKQPYPLHHFSGPLLFCLKNHFTILLSKPFPTLKREILFTEQHGTFDLTEQLNLPLKEIEISIHFHCIFPLGFSLVFVFIFMAKNRPWSPLGTTLRERKGGNLWLDLKVRRVGGSKEWISVNSLCGTVSVDGIRLRLLASQSSCHSCCLSDFHHSVAKWGHRALKKLSNFLQVMWPVLLAQPGFKLQFVCFPICGFQVASFYSAQWCWGRDDAKLAAESRVYILVVRRHIPLVLVFGEIMETLIDSSLPSSFPPSLSPTFLLETLFLV